MFSHSFCTDCQDFSFSLFGLKMVPPSTTYVSCHSEAKKRTLSKEAGQFFCTQYPFADSPSIICVQHIQCTYDGAPGTLKQRDSIETSSVRHSRPVVLEIVNQTRSVPFSYLLPGTKYLGRVHLLFVSFFSERYLWLKSESSEHKRIILD